MKPSEDWNCPWCDYGYDEENPKYVKECKNCHRPTVICGECPDGKCPKCVDMQDEVIAALREGREANV